MPRPRFSRASLARFTLSALATCATLSLALTVATVASPAHAGPAAPGPLPIVGRWDVTVSGPGYDYPAWFEITEADSGLAARFTGRFGAPVAVPYVAWDGRRLELRFTGGYRWTGTFNGRWFEGSTGGEYETWLAVRAPKLTPGRADWGKPEPIFDGRALAGWRARHEGSDHGWTVRDGALVNVFPGDDLVSLKRFRDFKLSLQFRLQPRSDSGVHLRGRYEVQLSDLADDAGRKGVTGAIYGQVAPSQSVACTAGEWHTLDVTLVGREVTVVLDSFTLIEHAPIGGITGDALDSDEGSPGPIVLQGYLGRVEFRNLVVTRGR